MQLEDLVAADPELRKIVLTIGNEFRFAEDVVRSAKFAEGYGSHKLDEILSEMEQMRYLVIITTQSTDLRKTFEGEFHVFEIDTGEHIGGMSLSVGPDTLVDD